MVIFEIMDYKSNKTELVPINMEYIRWAEKKLDQLYQSAFFDPNNNFEETIRNYSINFLDKTLSEKKSKSRFIVLKESENIIGMGGLNQLAPDIGEIKRMYIKEEYRNRGLGKELLTKLLEIGSEMDYRIIKLDSVKFMEKAHKLYEKAGFEYTGPYDGSEIPQEKQKYWVFMEKKLRNNQTVT